MTILMVDDEEACMELWSRMLGTKFNLLFSKSIEEALKRMAEIPPPDLVLLDLKIPPFTPEQSLLAVHAFREFNPNLAVVVISGMRLDEILKAIESAGVTIQGALSKDDSLSQTLLMDSVKAALVKGRNFKDSMETLEKVSEAIENEKKKTAKIDLP